MRGRSWWCQGFGAAAAAKALSETFGEAPDAEDWKHDTRTQTTHHTAQSGFRMMSLLSEQGCFFFVFFSQPCTEFCLTNYIDQRSRCLEFSSSQRGLDNTSLSPIRSLSFQTISICAMSSQQFHAIRDDCIVYTAAFKTITTCLGRNLSDSGHDRQFSWG